MTDYWIKYTDDTTKYITLPELEIDWYIHNEGDHVLEYGKMKDEQIRQISRCYT